MLSLSQHWRARPLRSAFRQAQCDTFFYNL
jgi:hypothetical protein